MNWLSGITQKLLYNTKCELSFFFKLHNAAVTAWSTQLSRRKIQYRNTVVPVSFEAKCSDVQGGIYLCPVNIYKNKNK